jgi:ABC-type enterochelin transport system substrate-binding protein
MEEDHKNKIEWTKEQEALIDSMVKESENIGYVQGQDDVIRELIRKLDNLIRELKSKIILKDGEL